MGAKEPQQPPSGMRKPRPSPPPPPKKETTTRIVDFGADRLEDLIVGDARIKGATIRRVNYRATPGGGVEAEVFILGASVDMSRDPVPSPNPYEESGYILEGDWTARGVSGWCRDRVDDLWLVGALAVMLAGLAVLLSRI